MARQRMTRRSGASRVIRRRGEAAAPRGGTIRLDARVLDGADPRAAVLLVHGFKGFKDWGFFPHLAERLALDGHLAVSFNGSRNGIGPDLLDFTELDAFSRNTISHELADVRWMIERTLAGAWSGGRAPESVGLLGHSRGGGVSVIAAAEHGGVASLATWAGVSTFHRWTAEEEEDWLRRGTTFVTNARTGQELPLDRVVCEDLRDNRERFDVLAAAARVAAPWLVVHGSEDATVPLAEGRSLARAGPRAELEVVPGSGHAFEAAHPWQGTTPGLKAAVKATLRHFRSSL